MCASTRKPGQDGKAFFQAAKEQKFDRAVNAQKIARSFSFHKVAARHPLVLECQIQGQGMKLVDKRWDVPVRPAYEGKIPRNNESHQDDHEQVRSRLGWPDE